MAAGLSASDLARAARSSWAFFASAAALRRSAKLVFLDLFISVSYAQDNGSWPKGSTVSDRRSPRHIPGHGRDQDLKAGAVTAMSMRLLEVREDVASGEFGGGGDGPSTDPVERVVVVRCSARSAIGRCPL